MTYLIIVGLIALSAIFSGLTLGLFSLDKDDLKIKSELGDSRAKKIYRLRKNGYLLLSTLLIGNVAVNSTLSIFLGSITSGFAAGIISTSLIVVFGEIMPQAAFAKHAFVWGARFSWLARFFMILLWPICRPLSLLLEAILGKEISTYYSKKELMKLIEHHEDSSSSEIDTDEERIVKGALSYSDKTVKDIMMPHHKVFALHHDTPLDDSNIRIISASGKSRIPIFGENLNEIIGILYAKDLIEQNYKNKKAGEIARKKVIFIDHNHKLDDLLNHFKRTRNHLFVVKDAGQDVCGIVTIEDVLEEIIGEEIHDEFEPTKLI